MGWNGIAQNLIDSRRGWGVNFPGLCGPKHSPRLSSSLAPVAPSEHNFPSTFPLPLDALPLDPHVPGDHTHHTQRFAEQPQHYVLGLIHIRAIPKQYGGPPSVEKHTGAKVHRERGYIGENSMAIFPLSQEIFPTLLCRSPTLRARHSIFMRISPAFPPSHGSGVVWVARWKVNFPELGADAETSTENCHQFPNWDNILARWRNVGKPSSVSSRWLREFPELWDHCF